MAVKTISEADLRKRKANLPKGARVVLDYMEDPLSTIPTGSLGTVRGVDDIGTIHINWDCGSCLGVTYDKDLCHRIPWNGNIFKKDILPKLKNHRNLRELNLFIPKTCEIFHMEIGDGSNLLAEDINEGYNSYIYTKTAKYSNFGEWECTEDDCPMVYFNEEIDHYSEDIALGVYRCLRDYLGTPDGECVDFIPLF